MRFFRFVCLVLFLLCNNAKANELVDIRAHTNLNNNNMLEVLLEFNIAPQWHIFAPYEQEFGSPLKIEWINVDKPNILEESYAKTHRYTQDMISFDGYETKAFYKSTLDIENNEFVIAKIQYMVCKDECLNQEKNLKILKKTSPDFTARVNQSKDYFLSHDFVLNIKIWIILLMAFTGGIILNLMPCIFPVLSIKIISLANMNREERSVEALFYGIGVIVSMLIIAGLLYGLRIFDNTIGWGFHMQSPWFVGFMFALFIILTLLMLDIININNSCLSRFAFLHFENHKINAFMTGLLAVVIATPCTAPFMGAAIAYALMAPIYIYFPIFFTLGLGYALPFAILAWNPLKIKRILPKPGKWMNVLKKILSIPLVLTCAWLFWVLLAQFGIITSSKSLVWQDYSSAKVEKALDEKRPVFIDFTAKWCITCMVNKQVALQSDDLAKIVKQRNILLLRADATNKDNTISKALAFYGRASVPLYVYYDGKSDDYLILPQILTPAILEEYLQ
ncbi:MAG: thioredoxin family protein [Alphaproteobacteria bacterium]|nr:thioredoxin family protein [Alphaproteobacteria bacterium]